MSNKKYTNFTEFYAFYLTEHSHKMNRLLHFLGTTLVLIVFVNAVLTQEFINLLYCPLIGYGMAWVGHYRFEKNKPATFKHPFYSFIADFVMWWHLLTRKIYF